MDNINLGSIKIIVQIVESGKMLARVTLEFGDMELFGFRVTGFKVLLSQYSENGHYDNQGRSIWVASPSYPNNIGRQTNIFFAPPSMWKDLERRIIEAYLNVTSA